MISSAQKKGRSGLVLFALICANSLFLLSCSSKPTDLRTLLPAESLIYLESNDLAATLQPIIDAKPFREAAKSRPDFSVLKGVQVAVAVTGFETSEEKLTDENSIARIMPRFVAVADTHAWNYQAVGFAEQRLGGFVADSYGGELKVEKADRHGGKYFTWTASNDNRRAFALVVDSLIYFGNDETAIEKSLAVRRGEADSIIKSGKVQPASADVLASGYISPDGIAQIASVAGMQLASQSSDESETQSAVAGIVPQLVRGAITEASWTMKRSEKGIEDSVVLTGQPEIARVLSETIVSAERSGASVLQFVPETASSVTRYSLKDARVAWRSAILSAQKLTDPLTGQIIAEVAQVSAAEYGIEDPELFLSAIKTGFATVRTDAEGEDSVIMVEPTDFETLKKAVSKEINLAAAPSMEGDAQVWQAGESDLALARRAGFVFLGSAAAVRACLQTNSSGFANMLGGTAPTATAGRDAAIAAKLIDVIAHENTDVRPVSSYVIETRFTRTAIERRTTSDFGLVGSIISFLDEE